MTIYLLVLLGQVTKEKVIPMFHGDLELDALFEDGVPWLAINDLFTLEWATYQRCFPAQPLLSALQRKNRRKCAYPLRDLAVTG